MPVRSVHVPNDRVREHARGLLAATRVDRHDLALAFEESRATSAEVLVEGRSFYPPMLADIEAATSSVHINQFGFRPGKVGDVVRAGARREGPLRSSRQARRRRAGLASVRHDARLLRRARRGGRRDRRHTSYEAADARRPARLLVSGALEHPRPRPHRSPQGGRRRRPDRMGRRCRHRGSLRGRTVPRPVRSRRGPRCRSTRRRVRRKLPVPRRLDSRERVGHALSGARGSTRTQLQPSFSTTLQADTGRSRTRSRRSWTARRRRSTSSIRTSQTGA